LLPEWSGICFILSKLSYILSKRILVAGKIVYPLVMTTYVSHNLVIKILNDYANNSYIKSIKNIIIVRNMKYFVELIIIE